MWILITFPLPLLLRDGALYDVFSLNRGRHCSSPPYNAAALTDLAPSEHELDNLIVILIRICVV